MAQPLFAEKTDVDVDPIERTEDADGIGTVLQDSRRHNGIGLDVKLRQVRGLGEILKLFVFELRAAQLLFAPTQRRLQPRANVVQGIHRARIIDRIARYEGSVEGSRQRSMQQLINKIRLILFPEEDSVDPEILGAGVGI